MRRFAIAASLVVLPACTSFQLVQPNESLPPHAMVAITFDEPRNLEVRRDSVVYSMPEVSTVYGELEAVRSDTLILRILGVESIRRQPELPDDARLTLVPGTSAQLSTSTTR